MNPNLGRLGIHHNESIVEMCTYVSKGDEVVAPYKGTTGIKCKVVVAAGCHARVVNINRNFDKWFNIQDLARMKTNET